MSAPATSQPDRGVAVPAAVGVIVAAVVGVLVLVGLAVSVTDDRLPTGPALAPPAPPEVAVSYDALLRRARFGEVVVTLPASPYTCPSDPEPRQPLLASGVLCHAAVHADDDGSSDWSATAGFGAVPRAASKQTAAETAAAVFDDLRSAAFAGTATTVSDRATQTLDLDGHRIAAVSGRIHYSVPGVASRYDRALVVVLPLADGSYAGYLSSRPDDSPRAVRAALDSSLDTLHYDG